MNCQCFQKEGTCSYCNHYHHKGRCYESVSKSVPITTPVTTTESRPVNRTRQAKRTKQIPNYRTVTETVTVTKTYDDGKGPRVENLEVAGVGALQSKTYQEHDGTYKTEDYYVTENYTDYENVQVTKNVVHYEENSSSCSCSRCNCPKCRERDCCDLSSYFEKAKNICSFSLVALKFILKLLPSLLFIGLGLLYGIYSKNWYFGYYVDSSKNVLSIFYIGYIVAGFTILITALVIMKKLGLCCCKRRRKYRDPEYSVLLS